MLNSGVMHRYTGPAPGIMVWGGIGYHSRTPLVRIAAELRRLGQVEREAAHRAAETPEQSQAQLQQNAEYLASQRAAETTEQSQARRLQQATYMTSQKGTETVEAAESRRCVVAKRALQRRLIFTRNTWWWWWGYSIKLHLSMTRLLIMEASSL
ncbi:hypothetical protein TNCV_1433651 [Trichonephila clavipes]|nr:hypothetical protein TNCV_1433651 [Trichonephila clavipes]